MDLYIVFMDNGRAWSARATRGWIGSIKDRLNLQASEVVENRIERGDGLDRSGCAALDGASVCSRFSPASLRLCRRQKVDRLVCVIVAVSRY